MDMELREFIALLKKERVLYALIIIGFLFLGLLWVTFEPKRYESNILITIGRTQSKTVAPVDYQYDNFYRLQADERFGDTLVRLLSTPQVTSDIFAEAGLSDSTPSSTYFTGRKLSSQIVEVTFTDKDQAKLLPLARSTSLVLNRYTKDLQADETEDSNWFRVIASEPVISDARMSQKQVFGIALFFGIFVGFWTVLLRQYLAQPKERK